MGIVLAALLASSAVGVDTPPPVLRDYTLTSVLEPGQCRIVIHPRAPWMLKATTPFEGQLQAAPDVTLLKSTFTEKDYLDPKAVDKTLLINFTAVDALQAHVRASLNFFLCTDQVCQRYREAVECKVAGVETPALTP